MSFLINFPATKYTVNGTEIDIPDIFRSVALNQDKIDAASAYQVYTIDEQRPDQLSTELYGSTDYHWTFFVLNPQLRQAWPYGFDSFNKYVDGKYNGHTITPYRRIDNLSPSGVNLPPDEPEYNSITGKFPIGSTLTGIGRPEGEYEGVFSSEISPSNATATIIERYPETNTIAFRYDVEGTSFTPDERIQSKSPNNIFHFVNDKYKLNVWKDAPMRYQIDNEYATNPNNFDYSQNYYRFFDYEFAENEKRRNIRVVREEYIRSFVSVYGNIINGR